jgi:hypothetical protein
MVFTSSKRAPDGQELKKQVAELTPDLQKANAQLATGRVRPTGGLELSKSVSHARVSKCRSQRAS